MKLVDAQLTLSPSDLSNFLACEHLTALELRGTPRPDARRSAGRADPAQGRRARAGLPRVAARRRARRPRDRARRRLGRRRGRDRGRRCATASTSSTRASSSTGAGAGSPTSSLRQPDGSYEALDTKLARHAKPSYILQLCFYNEQLARDPGARARADPRRARLGRAACRSGRRSSAPTTGASARGSSGSSPSRRPTEAVARRPLRRLRLQAGLRRALGRGRPPEPRRRASARADREAASRPGSRRSPTSAARRAEPRRPGSPPETCAKIREQAELQLCGARERRDRYALLPPQAGAGFALLPEPSPGDLFFDFEGNPFWDTDGGLEYLWGILDADRALHAAPRRTTTRASGGRSSSSSTSCTRACASTPTCTSTTTRTYEITALKRLMGRYGTREDEIDDLLRRGVFVDLLRVVRNGLRASRPGYGLKEMEAFLDFERRGGGQGRRRLDRRLRAVDADARRRAARADRRVQPRGLHRDAAPARLAARAASARRSRSSGRSRRAEPDEPRPVVREEGRARGAPAASCSTPARTSPRTCSTTTTASASRSGGGSSTGSR